MVSPVTWQLVADVLQVKLPGLDVTVYEILPPPETVEAPHDTVTAWLAEVPLTELGVVGAGCVKSLSG